MIETSDRTPIWIEAWSPEYGTSYDPHGLETSEEVIEASVETQTWEPLTPESSACPPMAFVDGVSRIDARAHLASGATVVAGVCASTAAGSVLTGPDRALFGPTALRRAAIFGEGHAPPMPSICAGIVYESKPAPGDVTESLINEVGTVRSELELEIARALARDGHLVVADGPLRGRREPDNIVGLIKSHQKTYLGPEREAIIAELSPGQRTPLFSFGAIRPRYSWYLRLADGQGQQPWAAIARCEASTAVPLAQAVRLADLTARHLPRFASKAYWDARAPQNLVPIASLERHLWRLLGDRDLVFRKVRSALARRQPALA